MSISSANPQTVPPSGDSRAIIQVPAPRQLEAIAALLPTGPSDRAAAERFIRFAADNRIQLDWMWGRIDRRGRIDSSVLLVPSAGRTAMLFHSQPPSPRAVASIGQLIDHACQQLDRDRVALAQVLIERGAQLDQSALQAGGFQKLAELSYLDRPVPMRLSDDLKTQWPDGCALEPYTPERRAEWQSTLESTYIDTLDCPSLLGLRRTTDILDGHFGTGRFDPKLWHLLRVDNQPVGMIMFNPASNLTSIELVYLGLSPQARGKGFGARLLRTGLATLIGRAESSITLAVDEGNVPALRLYAAHGFRRMLRRVAMIRSLHTSIDS